MGGVDLAVAENGLLGAPADSCSSRNPLCCSGEGSRLPYATIGLASQLDVRMSGAALIELTMANFRAALGLGTAGPDCNIRVPEKHAAGLLCALRTGKVTCCSIFHAAVENLHFGMNVASPRGIHASGRWSSHACKTALTAQCGQVCSARETQLQPTHHLLTDAGHGQVAIFCSR